MREKEGVGCEGLREMIQKEKCAISSIVNWCLGGIRNRQCRS